jgi:long-subunit acyl-CoA synthetase (AMP-forming)
MQTPLEALWHWERESPDAVYMVQPQPDGSVIEYTWAQVADQVRRMAGYLKSLRLPPGSAIALLGKNSAHWIMADLAAWMAGHVTVPLYPTLDRGTARYILDHSEARLAFVGKLDSLDLVPANLPTIALPLSPLSKGPQWMELVREHAPLVEPEPRDRQALATIVYTSGTTGQPKGVMHSFASLCAPVRTAREIWKLTSADRQLSYLPLAHIGERVALEMPSLLLGFRVYFNHSLETFPADLRRCRPTWFFSVPRLWTKFYQAIQAAPPEQRRAVLAQLGLDQVRIATTAAAPMAPAVMAAYRDVGIELLEVFGMTENAATSHACRPGTQRLGYVGTPLPGVECRIAEDGEVLVKSPGQMLGYYKEPELTAAQFTPDGFLKTGDRGQVDAEGWLRITGRSKELFKTSKGKYVAPAPIENKLVMRHGIEAVCVTGPGQPEPFALVMLSADTPRASAGPKLETLLEEVNASLGDHERLKYIVVIRDPWTIESGLLTPTLKIKRHEIEKRYLPRAEAWRESGQRVIYE